MGGDVSSPSCYVGTATTMGQTEDFYVSVKKYNGNDGTGVVDLKGSGARDVECNDKTFTKSGQDITVDWGDCLSSSIKHVDIKYCSDSQTADIQVQAVSYGLTVAVDASLRKVPCHGNPFRRAPQISGSEIAVGTVAVCAVLGSIVTAFCVIRYRQRREIAERFILG